MIVGFTKVIRCYDQSLINAATLAYDMTFSTHSRLLNAVENFVPSDSEVLNSSAAFSITAVAEGQLDPTVSC